MSIVHGEIKKRSYITINLKYQLLRGMINLNYLMDHTLYRIFKIILSTSLNTMKQYLRKEKSRVKFKIKSECCLEKLTPETMKLLGSTKAEIAKDKNGENMPFFRNH